MSTHKVEVVPVVLDKHPDADSLSIVRVWGFTCVVRTADYQDGRCGAYIPPDSLVDTARLEFAFLASKAKYGEGGRFARIRVAKLRGRVSMGLLIPARPEWTIGQDVMADLGVLHYEPPVPLSTGGEDAPSPSGYRPCYDVENWRRYKHLFVPGEAILVTEKIHGANGRFCFVDGEMHAGSRTTWKRRDPKSIWWRALDRHPEVMAFCEGHPGLTVYGEVYGQVQDLRYGAAKGEVRIAVFDILDGSTWLAEEDARTAGAVMPWVPTIYFGPYDETIVESLADGESRLADAGCIREGVVVKPAVERTDPEIGRVQLKIVSNAYLERP